MQISMFLSEELHANLSRSQDCERELQTRAETSCLNTERWLNDYNPSGLSGKTSPVFCRVTQDGILEPFSGCWANSGMGSRTEFLTLNSLEFPNEEEGCSLSDIVEIGNVPQKYFLSEKALAGIVRRLESKNKLPELKASIQKITYVMEFGGMEDE
jgi:hypothetical protein